MSIFRENHALRVASSGEAPIGALMFWGPARPNGNHGLIGLSAGNGYAFLVQGSVPLTATGCSLRALLRP